MSSALASALGDLKEEEVLSTVQKRLAEGTSALSCLEELQRGMAIVGERYEKGEYFLSDLVFSAAIFRKASDLLGSELTNRVDTTFGTMVLGTVFGDIHDFGKNIVGMVLSCNGINVVDLGVNVPYERFLEAIREHRPQLVGLSCLLTTAFESMKRTTEAIEGAGLRDGVKIIVGGGPVDRRVCEYVRADDYGRNAQEAVDLARRLLGVK